MLRIGRRCGTGDEVPGLSLGEASSTVASSQDAHITSTAAGAEDTAPTGVTDSTTTHAQRQAQAHAQAQARAQAQAQAQADIAARRAITKGGGLMPSWRGGAGGMVGTDVCCGAVCVYDLDKIQNGAILTLPLKSAVLAVHTSRSGGVVAACLDGGVHSASLLPVLLTHRREARYANTSTMNNL